MQGWLLHTKNRVTAAKLAAALSGIEDVGKVLSGLDYVPDSVKTRVLERLRVSEDKKTGKTAMQARDVVKIVIETAHEQDVLGKLNCDIGWHAR
jgi:hypothetical protein